MFQIIPEQQKCFLILTTAVFHISILPNLDAAQNLKIFKRKKKKQPTIKTNNQPNLFLDKKCSQHFDNV